MHPTWTVTVAPIPEWVIPGKRLGRHVRHDSRSLAYRWQRSGVPLRSVAWPRLIGILDQGAVGSCTGNAETGALGTGPLYAPLAARPQGVVLDEVTALALYSAAEVVDGDGPYPPNDNGSCGLSVCQAAKNAGYIAGYLHCLSIGDIADALQVGPVIAGSNWYDCVVPDSRILTPDLRWVPIQKLAVGDEVLSFDETSPDTAGRRYRRGTVLANDLTVKPAVTLHYELGEASRELTVSEGHLFLVYDLHKGQSWRRADQLRLGDEIYSLVAPFEPDQSRVAGWLAGFFDGEGSVGTGTHLDRGTQRRSYRLDVAQKVGPTLDELKRCLSVAGFEFRVQSTRQDHPVWKPVEVLWLPGGRSEILRFLGTIRPERLVANSAGFWEGQLLRSKTQKRATVTGLRRTSKQELHAIGTSTGTLLVEGLLSHNSFDNPPSSGVVSISPDATVRGGHEYVMRVLDVDRQLVGCDNSWGTSWGTQVPGCPTGGSFWLSWSTAERLLAEQGDVTSSVPLGQPVPKSEPL